MAKKNRVDDDINKITEGSPEFKGNAPVDVATPPGKEAVVFHSNQPDVTVAKCEFNGHVFVASNQEEIDRLRNHTSCGDGVMVSEKPFPDIKIYSLSALLGRVEKASTIEALNMELDDMERVLHDNITEEDKATLGRAAKNRIKVLESK